MIEQILVNFFSIAGLLAALAFFIKKWMDDIKSDIGAVCEALTTKVGNQEFNDYKNMIKELREERDKDIAHIKDRVNHHGHEVECDNNECKAKASKVVLR